MGKLTADAAAVLVAMGVVYQSFSTSSMDLKEVTDESSSSLSPPIHPTLFALDSIFPPFFFLTLCVCFLWGGESLRIERDREERFIWMTMMMMMMMMKLSLCGGLSLERYRCSRFV
uniref:Uncharacterized protein n=1 Tax=Opuntia streptacantha TaxID=393608 RepID=A0A7C8YR91_OPUST